jgi:hypothetical protein
MSNIITTEEMNKTKENLIKFLDTITIQKDRGQKGIEISTSVLALNDDYISVFVKEYIALNTGNITLLHDNAWTIDSVSDLYPPYEEHKMVESKVFGAMWENYKKCHKPQIYMDKHYYICMKVTTAYPELSAAINYFANFLKSYLDYFFIEKYRKL